MVGIKTLAQIKADNAVKPFTFGNPSMAKLGKLADESNNVFVATDKVEVYEVTDYQNVKSEAIRVYTTEGHRVRINDPEVLTKLEVGTKLNCIKQSFQPTDKDGKVTSTRKIPYLFLDSIATA